MGKPFFLANAVDLFSEGLLGLPDLTYRFVRQELVRFAKRFKKQFIKNRMSGRPGIDAPRMAKGKHVRTWVKGENRQVGTLVAYAQISRILKAHEEGRTITAKGGGYLFLKRGNKVFAKVRSVKLPARLGFRSEWESTLPDTRARIKRSMERAVKVSNEQKVKKVLDLAG